MCKVQVFYHQDHTGRPLTGKSGLFRTLRECGMRYTQDRCESVHFPFLLTSMSMHFEPHIPGCLVDDILHEGETVTIMAHTSTACAACPECGQSSSRIHSRYHRTLADLPWSGQ